MTNPDCYNHRDALEVRLARAGEPTRVDFVDVMQMLLRLGMAPAPHDLLACSEMATAGVQAVPESLHVLTATTPLTLLALGRSFGTMPAPEPHLSLVARVRLARTLGSLSVLWRAGQTADRAPSRARVGKPGTLAQATVAQEHNDGLRATVVLVTGPRTSTVERWGVFGRLGQEGLMSLLLAYLPPTPLPEADLEDRDNDFRTRCLAALAIHGRI